MLKSLEVPLRSAALLLLILAILGTSNAGHRNAYPLPEERGTAGTLAALKKLPLHVRVLQTIAHPDDENAATLAWLARKAHARTALFSLTRGDGGQNVLGDEKYEGMGLIRTGELIEACRLYGVETYFSTAFEFGFSKSAEETLSKWGREATLEEMVRFIRMWRPTIIISRWQGNSSDGHGHHQATGIVTQEAFRAAGDPKRFPEQLQSGLRPWQATKLYQNVRVDPAEGRGRRPGERDWTVRIDVGEYDPVLGRSFREIGSEGYSKHRSQGNASSYSTAGRSYEYYRLIDSTVGLEESEESLFDSLDTSLPAILELAGEEQSRLSFLEQDLASLQALAEEALASFAPHRPEAGAPAAAKGVALLREMIRKVQLAEASDSAKTMLHEALSQKLLEFQDAAAACMGIYLTTRTEDPTAIPGEKIAVTTLFFNRGAEKVDLKSITLRMPEGWVAGLPANAPYGTLEPGDSAAFEFEVQIPADAPVTEPFWYREKSTDDRYETRPIRNVFAPYEDPLIVANATYRFRGTDLSLLDPARAQVNDVRRGVDFVDFQIVPAISVSLHPALSIVPLSGTEQKREFQISLVSNRRERTRGEVEIRVPSAWRSEPAQVPFDLNRKGESFTTRVTLHIPATIREGTQAVEAVARAGSREYRRGYRAINYPENWTRHLYEPARSELKIFDVKWAPGFTVGYVPGAGDEVAASLSQLGLKVERLGAEDLAFGDLSRFGAIVTGIRAYNVNDDLVAHNQRLLHFVRDGGTLIVQYNTPGPGDSPFNFGPYPLRSSRNDRITVEDSPLRMLDPRHAIFTTPNRIEEADFRGWVQERGLYFMTQWDERYTALLSGSDPGEEPLNGGLLVARHGQGYYIFSAYSWFRQLPAGVPGAFRLFANMLSIGR